MSVRHPEGRPASNPAENYERFFVPAIGRPLAEDLIRAAALRPGERVLDLGCGTGVVTRLAAEGVQPDGRAAGLDLNPEMLAVARSVTPPELGIEWYEASAESLPLPDQSFDVVLCQMALQFVPDRHRCLEEVRRVLAPGGRFVLNLPGPASPFFDAMAHALGRHIAPQAEGFLRAVFALNDEGEITDLLGAAGFREVSTRAEVRELSLPAPGEFLWQYVGSTPLATIVGQASDQARTALEDEVVGQYQGERSADGMTQPQRVVTARARR